MTAAASIEDIAVQIGAALCAEGALEAESLARAQRLASETGERLDHVLARLGLVGDGAIAAALARMSGAPLVDPAAYAESPELLHALGARFAADARILPLEDDGETVRLAMADPLDAAVAELAAMKLGRRVSRFTATPTEIENALERVAEDGRSVIDSLAEAAGGAEDDIAADVARLADMASEAPVIRIVNLLIRRAAEIGASDIHLEPSERKLRLRYRVDGALREADSPPGHLRAAIVSRLKIMAKLDIAESRLPQDGRIKATVLGRALDMRVATTPTLHGEGVVIRLLDRSGLTLDYEGLGVDAAARAALIPLIERPNGVLLVTGPTGSGKTTTLYATLARLNAPHRKIITVEDPIEYQLEGVNQIQVRSGIGLGFAEALRSILRQDPDVIMIGEIRDLETARIAVQAALTGHLVLATLHTNSAAAAINRLRDMGVADYLIAATVIGCVAQRLVRKLCSGCSETDPDPAPLARSLGADHAPGAVRRAVGCAACGGVGYRGRTTVLEVLTVTDAVRRQILDQSDERVIEQTAISAGMRSLRAHGLERAAAGETSLAEVARVAGGL